MADQALPAGDRSAGRATDEPAGPRAANQAGASRERQSGGGLLRAAATPVIAACLILALLFTWTITGGAGTLQRVRITVGLAAIPVPLMQRPGTRQPAAATYLVLHSEDGQDELTGASTPKAARVIFARDGRHPFSSALRLPGISIPAHGGIELSPFGVDVVLLHPAALHDGEIVPVTLRFRNAGTVVVDLQVTTSLPSPH